MFMLGNEKVKKKRSNWHFVIILTAFFLKHAHLLPSHSALICWCHQSAWWLQKCCWVDIFNTSPACLSLCWYDPFFSPFLFFIFAQWSVSWAHTHALTASIYTRTLQSHKSEWVVIAASSEGSAAACAPSSSEASIKMDKEEKCGKAQTLDKDNQLLLSLLNLPPSGREMDPPHSRPKARNADVMMVMKQRPSSQLKTLLSLKKSISLSEFHARILDWDQLMFTEDRFVALKKLQIFARSIYAFVVAISLEALYMCGVLPR